MMRTWVAFGVVAFGSAVVMTGARAQDAQASAPASQGAAATADGTASSGPGTTSASNKKVWTNDDVGGLRREAPISNVGVPAAKQARQNQAQAKAPANAATVRRYHDQIVALQKQLPDLDSKISELQGAVSGDTVNSTRHVGGVKIDDWHDQLTRLQAQRTDVAARINALQDQARHSGVPENEIPE
jgi:septal ring factor EnvC (AmiA/AmiB activator)